MIVMCFNAQGILISGKIINNKKKNLHLSYTFNEFQT